MTITVTLGAGYCKQTVTVSRQHPCDRSESRRSSCTLAAHGPLAGPAAGDAEIRVTRSGSYASTHAHLGTDCRWTLWEPRAASGPEELRDSERI